MSTSGHQENGQGQGPFTDEVLHPLLPVCQPGNPAVAAAGAPAIVVSVPPEVPSIEGSFGYDFFFKVALLGNSCSGKTSLLHSLAADFEFDPVYKSTIVIDFKTEDIIVENRKIRLQIWDTSGNEKYQSLNEVFLRDLDAVVICFDITNRASFKGVTKWMKKMQTNPYSLKGAHKQADQIQRSSKRTGDLPCMIVGCKCDLTSDRQVTLYEGQDTAIRHGTRYFETSALSKQGVRELFGSLATSILGRTVRGKYDLNRELSVEEAETKRVENDEFKRRSAFSRRSSRLRKSFTKGFRNRTKSLNRSFRPQVDNSRDAAKFEENESGERSASSNIEETDISETIAGHVNVIDGNQLQKSTGNHNNLVGDEKGAEKKVIISSKVRGVPRATCCAIA